MYRGSGAIIRGGQESDGFCRELQRTYEIAGSSAEIPDLVQTTVVSLGTDPGRIAGVPLKMKMFVASRSPF